ncbi:MucR family transcriptional regulator [Pseudochelatococcus sp. B33]
MSSDVGQVLSKAGLISVTADIVAAYVANNSLPPAEVLQFIEGVHATFSRLQRGEEAETAPAPAAAADAAPASSPSAPPAEAAEEVPEKPLPTRQVDEELFRKAQLRNPPNALDPRTGALQPLDFEELVPDEEGYVFDPAWIDPDIYVDQKPIVPVEKTVKADSIICLENGKALKVLKRHLDTEFGLTPDAYRRKWGLSDHYPLVTHAFSTSRSKYAREQGLGKTRNRSR